MSLQTPVSSFVPRQTTGTRRIADDTPVRWTEAMQAWIPLAHAELLRVAGRYGAVITYGELAEHVQVASGIRTRMLLANWIGKVLEAVAQQAADRDEPPLTALCVHADGTIGEGYAHAPKCVIDEPGEDLEWYAAEHRLLCYRRYATDLPADGGKPLLTEAVAQQRQKAKPPAPPAVCPVHSVVLPATGVCDDCA